MEGLYTATKDPYFVGLHSTPRPIVFTLLKLEGVDGFFSLPFTKYLNSSPNIQIFAPLIELPPSVVLQRFFC
jgi:hypothetical protein